MEPDRPTGGDRRRFLRLALGGPALLALGRAGTARGQGPALPPTPACGGTGDVTPFDAEGPYFKAGSPRRASLLEPAVPGPRLVIAGRVLTADCRPIARALVDFWQADARGRYDNAGYRLRGHQFTDDAGRYRLETVVPGLYPGRTRHLHVRVQAPGQPVLTTQLYFPGEPENGRDGLFNRALLLRVEDTADGQLATFDFVLDDQLRRNRARPRGG